MSESRDVSAIWYRLDRQGGTFKDQFGSNGQNILYKCVMFFYNMDRDNES